MSCPLLSLPPELRNQIYEYLFYIPAPSTIRLVRNRDGSKQSVLNLLQTCRMIHDEAEGVFYSLNYIEVRGLDIWFRGNDLHTFLKMSGQSRKDALRVLTISITTCEDLCYCLKELRKMRFLSVLYLDVDVKQFIRWSDREIRTRASLLRRRVLAATSITTIRFATELTTIPAEIEKLDNFERLFREWIALREERSRKVARDC